MVEVHIVFNDSEVPLDRYREWLSQPGIELVEHDLPAGDPLPPANADGIVIMGGRQDAYDDEASPFLPGVRDMIADGVAGGTPILGICLGAQLIGAATGGEVTVADPRGPEKGYVQVFATAEGLDDPVVGPALAAGTDGAVWVPVMHSDAVTTLPDDAQVLASSDLYVHAFRVGSATAVQFHPEAGPDLLLEWARLTGGDAAAIAEASVRVDGEARAAGEALAKAWIETVLDRPRGEAKAS